MKNTLTCREATRLLLDDEDRELPPSDRLAWQVHVRICCACQRFVSQLNLVRSAMSAWRKHAEPPGDEPGPA